MSPKDGAKAKLMEEILSGLEGLTVTPQVNFHGGTMTHVGQATVDLAKVTRLKDLAQRLRGLEKHR